MLKQLLMTVVTAQLAACATEPVHFDQPRKYVRVVPGFDDLQECRDATVEDPLFNCTQDAQFCPDGVFELHVTDILSGGTYSIDADRVNLSFEPGSDVHIVAFEVQEDESLVAPDLGSRPFVHDLTPAFPITACFLAGEPRP